MVHVKQDAANIARILAEGLNVLGLAYLEPQLLDRREWLAAVEAMRQACVEQAQAGNDVYGEAVLQAVDRVAESLRGETSPAELSDASAAALASFGCSLPRRPI
jgi:hypothetical protein